MQLASAFGRPVQEILEQPYALTLWTWMELQEYKRITRLLEWNDDIRRASLTAVAFHDTEKLNDEKYAWKKAAGLVVDADTARKRAEELVKQIAALQPAENADGTGPSGS